MATDALEHFTPDHGRKVELVLMFSEERFYLNLPMLSQL